MKKIAVISDMSCYGRCSLTVALPIISALGVQCCPVPTVILSSHTGYDDVFFDDYSKNTSEYMQKWENINLEFDGYLTGFFASANQIDNIYDILKNKQQSVIIVDPIMADNGKLYSSYTMDMVDSLKNLCNISDILLPNLTEACILTGTPYEPDDISTEKLVEICEKLTNDKNVKICITGIVKNDEILNFLYINGEYKIIKVPKIGEIRCGTGDVFASVVSAGVILGESMLDCVLKATNFISQTLKVSIDEDILNGICFEKTLVKIGDFNEN